MAPMGRLLAKIRRTTWPSRLVCASGVLGLLFSLQLLVNTQQLTVPAVVLCVGLSLAWACAVSAALLVCLTLVQKLRRRPLSAVSWPPITLLGGAFGLGFGLVMVVLLSLAFDEPAAILLLVSGCCVAAAARFHRRPPKTLTTTLAVLIAIVAVFCVSREQGVVSVVWNKVQTKADWQWDGGGTCLGNELGNHPAEIAAYRPAYRLVSELDGPLGELVNTRINKTTAGGEPFAPGTVDITVRGHLDYGAGACYLPLFKSDDLVGSLDMDVSYSATWPAESASLHCSSQHTLRYSIQTKGQGFSSCRNLAEQAAAQLVAQLHSLARSICGR